MTPIIKIKFRKPNKNNTPKYIQDMICLVCKMLEQYEKEKGDGQTAGRTDGQTDGQTEKDNNNISKFSFEMWTVSKIEHITDVRLSSSYSPWSPNLEATKSNTSLTNSFMYRVTV